MAARNRPPNAATTRLGIAHRDAIQASMLLKRLQGFVKHDPQLDWPPGVNMTRTQVHVALALLRKVLPDLASVEVSGNPEKPLMVQVVRFSDGEEISQARPVLEMGKLLEMERAEVAAAEAADGLDDGSANTYSLGSEQKQDVTAQVRRTQSPSNRKNGPKTRVKLAIRERARAGRKSGV